MMRTILVLFLLLVVMGSVRGDAVSAPLRFTVTDPSEAPFAQPRLRLLALPSGATSPEVRVLGSSGDPSDASTGIEVTSLQPMTLRGLPVLPILVTVHGEKSASRSVDLEVSFQGSEKSLSGLPETVRYGRSFFRSMREYLVGGTEVLAAASEDGSYLIITHPNFLEAADSLAAWKTREGLPTSVVTTDEAGGTRDKIREYIRRLYHQSSVPPEYVLLIGDTDLMPTYSISGSVSDHYYALMDTTDFIPDLFVGRISVQTASDAMTAVMKTIHYEREPYLGDNGAWMGRGLVVATNTNATTPISLSRWCRDQMLRSGFAEVDSAFRPTVPPPRPPETYQSRILNSINAGKALVTYRGWAAAERGWSQQFETSDVSQLQNGSMLPVVFSFVCENNKFDLECFGEGWTRAGTADSPKGAVAFIGNSETWSHTRYNDAVAVGAFTGIEQGARKLGAILLTAKMHLFQAFPKELTFKDNGEESAEFYFYIYGLLGDPDLEIWSGPPRTLAVSHPATYQVGNNWIRVVVHNAANSAPFRECRVGVVQGARLVGSGYSDENGVASFPMAGLAGPAPIRITVTGPGAIPYEGLMTASTSGPNLVNVGVAVAETGQENGDHVPNPADTLDCRVTLRNDGASPVGSVQATLTAQGTDQVKTGQAAYAAIPVGETADAAAPFVVRINPKAEDGSISLFLLRLVVGADTLTSQVRLEVKAPSLRVKLYELAEGPAIRPGQTTTLRITVANNGSIPAPRLDAVLHSLDRGLMTMIDSVASYEAIPVGGEALNAAAFRVAVSDTAVIGRAANLVLTLTSSTGAVMEAPLAIPIGVADVTSPLGPDAHGYWAIDSADTDYSNVVPTYDWVECSPLYGGSGTKLTILDNQSVEVGLPFDFTYYGQTYNRIQVSDNGWLAFDLVPYVDFYNWGLPSAYGCGARVAAFWDNLVADRESGSLVVFDGVYTYYDQARNAFVVEWSRLKNRDQPPPPPPEPGFGAIFDDLQTFEVLLYDPRHYPESTAGIIQMQYKQIYNVDQKRMYATVGIENEARDAGIEYTYFNSYPPQAAPLSPGLAIRFTKQSPRYNPFALTSFQAQAADGGVALFWEPCDSRPRNGYHVYRAAPGGEFGRISSERILGDARSFYDQSADPAASYLYKIGAIDAAGKETLLGPYVYPNPTQPLSPTSLALMGANPIRGVCKLTFSAPAAGASLQVYNVTGRVMRTLVQRTRQAGSQTILFDGKDDRGTSLQSGVYFARLRAGKIERMVRLVLLD